jgi:hypothetical protein
MQKQKLSRKDAKTQSYRKEELNKPGLSVSLRFCDFACAFAGSSSLKINAD